MAQSIADDHWRLNRVSAIETNMFALGHYESPGPDNISDAVSDDLSDSTEPDSDIHAALNSARVFLADAKQFALLSIYEQRIHRNLQKSMTEFRCLQSARVQQSAAQAKTSANVQHKPVNNLPARRAENGFEFSNHPVQPPIPPAHVMDPAEFLKTAAAAAG
jgi:hypothetical protein